MHRARLPYLLIPLAAFLAIIPLLINGCSCGHDFDFHLLSWMEAARQFTHGNLHPHWAYTAAWKEVILARAARGGNNQREQNDWQTEG